MMGKPFSVPSRCDLLFFILRPWGFTLKLIRAVLSACALGQKTILPLEPNDGGYVRADARGYQFLLDFHGAGREFRSFSLQDLLSGGIDEAAFRDKIVLIGVVAESVKDFFYTPLSRSLYDGQHMAGVALHGHVTSQLIRLALGQSSPIRSLGEKQEVAWTFLWGLMGGAVGLLIRSPWRFSVAGLAGLLALVGSVYLAFIGTGGFR